MKRLGAAILILGGIVYLYFGTLSPCGMLREHLRKRDSLAAAMPDVLVDVALAAHYGALSPGRCVAILVSDVTSSITRTPAATPPPVTQLQPRPQGAQPQPQQLPDFRVSHGQELREVERAMYECRARRLAGELRNFAETARCSNPRIVQAFSAANYRYMDLIASFADKRLRLAEHLDRHDLTEAQAEQETLKYWLELANEDRRRGAVAP
jgi:hypothetical protein